VAEVQGDQIWRVFPNPAGDVINIESNEIIESIKIFNVFGQLVQNEIVAQEFSTLDVNQLPEGLYIVQIEMKSSEIYTKKIMKN
jgi:hypothetical protein